MSNKNLSIEELLNIAKNKPQKTLPIEEATNDCDRFIIELNIKSGEDRVPGMVIYYTYKKWKGLGRPRARNVFMRDFAKKFNHKKRNGKNWYLLDNSEMTFDTSEETKQLIEEDYNKEVLNAKRAKEKRERIKKARLQEKKEKYSAT